MRMLGEGYTLCYMGMCTCATNLVWNSVSFFPWRICGPFKMFFLFYPKISIMDRHFPDFRIKDRSKNQTIVATLVFL